MNSFLAHLHTELRRALLTRRRATHRPEDVPRSTHKAYPRMTQIALPEPTKLATTLQDALENRKSGFSGDPEIPILQSELGTLLGSALRARPITGHRNYPSGGA